MHEIEQAGRMARGRPLVNHLEGLGREERVQAVVAVKEFDDQHYLVCATTQGPDQEDGALGLRQPAQRPASTPCCSRRATR